MSSPPGWAKPVNHRDSETFISIQFAPHDLSPVN